MRFEKKTKKRFKQSVITYILYHDLNRPLGIKALPPTLLVDVEGTFALAANGRVTIGGGRTILLPPKRDETIVDLIPTCNRLHTRNIFGRNMTILFCYNTL